MENERDDSQENNRLEKRENHNSGKGRDFLDQPGSIRSHEVFFYIASTLLFLSSLMIFTGRNSDRLAVLFTLLGLVASMIFLIIPAVLRSREQSVMRLGVLLDRVENRVYDLDAIRREHRKALTRMEHIQGGLEVLEKSILEARKLSDEIISLRQEQASKQRLMERIIQAMIDYCDLIYRTLDLPGLAPDYQSAISKCLSEFKRMFSVIGFNVIFPEKGDPFDDRIHNAVEVADSKDLSSSSIVVRCCQAGYRWSTDIIRKAEVTIAAGVKPEGE